MPPPDLPSPSEVPLSRAEKEKLLQKMYSLPHWIAIIRLFASQTLAMDRAREAIKPIAEQYGKPEVADACEALVEIQATGKDPVARMPRSTVNTPFYNLRTRSTGFGACSTAMMCAEHCI